MLETGLWLWRLVWKLDTRTKKLVENPVSHLLSSIPASITINKFLVSEEYYSTLSKTLAKLLLKNFLKALFFYKIWLRKGFLAKQKLALTRPIIYIILIVQMERNKDT